MRSGGSGLAERKENTCSWRLEATTPNIAMHVILADSLINNTTLARLEKANYTLPPDHRDGGLPLISDSLFSLIIMLYVLLAFVFVFFLFCWRRGPDQPLLETKVRLGLFPVLMTECQSNC